MEIENVSHSLSRMAEEYNRIVSPLTDRIGISNRWDEMSSSVLRVAKMNDDVIKGVSKFDISLAAKLEEMTLPHRSTLEKIASDDKLIGANLSQLLDPKVYIPSLSYILTQTGKAARISSKSVQNTNIEKTVSTVSSVTDTLNNTSSPWLTELKVISDFNTSGFTDTNLRQLVEVEKNVANQLRVLDDYNHIISISAQIASINTIKLTDAWKKAVASPALLFGLNNFAIKQYKKIQKETDKETVAWRLGLLDAASKYVDTQISWGSDFAADNEGCIPEVEINAPDLSELPVFLSYAKRDNVVVDKAYEKSSFSQIAEEGQIIIQKAQVINSFCKSQNRPILFGNDDLVNWGMVLVGTFARSQDDLCYLMDTLYSMFVRKDLIELIGHQECFDTIDKNRDSSEKRKASITKIQKNVYRQIIKVEDIIIDRIQSKEDFLDEDTVSSKVLKALLNIQKDKNYYGVNENSINDGIRNQLSMVYEVKDQTRQGDSESGKDAGNIDIMICNNGNPTALLEGLKLDSMKGDYLDAHINKVLTSYDPFGCPLIYILIYSTAHGFNNFWNKVMEHIKGFKFPYEVVEGPHDIRIAYTESRHAKAVLNRDGKNITIHMYAISIR